MALVGPSGAGKSTVARLLLRYADPDQGHIRIGGVDLRDMQTDTLMQQISFVFQDNFLFADTIANNIRLGAPDTPLEAVISAARVAQAHEFISALPEGTAPASGSAASFSPAVSGSASPSPGRCCRIAPFLCSMRRRRLPIRKTKRR